VRISLFFLGALLFLANASAQSGIAALLPAKAAKKATTLVAEIDTLSKKLSSLETSNLKALGEAEDDRIVAAAIRSASLSRYAPEIPAAPDGSYFGFDGADTAYRAASSRARAARETLCGIGSSPGGGVAELVDAIASKGTELGSLFAPAELSEKARAKVRDTFKAWALEAFSLHPEIASLVSLLESKGKVGFSIAISALAPRDASAIIGLMLARRKAIVDLAPEAEEPLERLSSSSQARVAFLAALPSLSDLMALGLAARPATKRAETIGDGDSPPTEAKIAAFGIGALLALGEPKAVELLGALTSGHSAAKSFPLRFALYHSLLSDHERRSMAFACGIARSELVRFAAICEAVSIDGYTTLARKAEEAPRFAEPEIRLEAGKALEFASSIARIHAAFASEPDAAPVLKKNTKEERDTKTPIRPAGPAVLELLERRDLLSAAMSDSRYADFSDEATKRLSILRQSVALRACVLLNASFPNSVAFKRLGAKSVSVEVAREDDDAIGNPDRMAFFALAKTTEGIVYIVPIGAAYATPIVARAFAEVLGLPNSKTRDSERFLFQYGFRVISALPSGARHPEVGFLLSKPSTIFHFPEEWNEEERSAFRAAALAKSDVDALRVWAIASRRAAEKKAESEWP